MSYSKNGSTLFHLGCIILFIGAIAFSAYLRYQYDKNIIKDAIREMQQETKHE